MHRLWAYNTRDRRKRYVDATYVTSTINQTSIQQVIICNECKKQSLIAHYLKYFIKSNGQVVLGGNDLEGPLCQQCWFDIGDRALGKPTLLQKEQDK